LTEFLLLLTELKYFFKKKFYNIVSFFQWFSEGKIPDAATIHAARKQRQHQREMGDFIPLEDPSR
jgi:hypothetical protein